MTIARRMTHVLVIVLMLVIGAAAAAIIVSQTAWFKNWLRGYIVAQANQYLNGTLTINGLKGNLFSGIEMEDIGVAMDGQPVVAVKDVGLNYNAYDLLTKGLSVDSIRVNKPVIYLRREGDTWSLSRLVKKQEQEANRQGPARPISIEEIGISDGAVVVDGPVGTSGVEVPKRFDHLDAKLSFKYDPVHYSIEISHVSFRGSEPAIALNALSGGIAVHGDVLNVERLAVRTAETSISIDGAVQKYTSTPILNLQVNADKLSLPEIARLVPALAGVKLQPQVRVKVDGPLDRLGVDMNVQSSAGALSGKVVADVQAPGQSIRGDVAVRHLDLAPILNDPKQKSDITADARIDVRGAAFSDVDTLRGSLSLHAPRGTAAGYTAGPIDANARIEGRNVGINARASAYGASATADGSVTLPDTGNGRNAEPLAFDVKGEVRHLDLRSMPKDLKVPPAATDVNADYHVAGTVSQVVEANSKTNSHVRRAPTHKRARASDVAPASAIGGTETAGGAVPGARRGSGPDRTLSARVGADRRVHSASTAVNGKNTNHINGKSTNHVNVNGDLRFLVSSVAGADIASGSTVGFAMNGDEVSYSADATVAGLDLQRVGREFNVPALAADRYASTINGHVTAQGKGTAPKEMEVSASGTLNDSSIMGGRIPEVTFDASLAGDTAHVKAQGRVADLDPAVASGRPDVKGTIGGRLDLDATVAHVSEGMTPEAVQARANVELDPSTIADLQISSAKLDADYQNSIGEIRALQITGPDINVQANGTLALTDDGQSNLKLHADSPSLDRIGKVVNQPLVGIANLDATITGNRPELQVKGTFTGNDLKYGNNGALVVASDFDARIPDLRPADATGSAKTHATFATLGGQNINELDATAAYDQRQIEFDVNAKQPQRTLAGAGTLVMHPDHQEVHLRSFAFNSQGVQWQSAGESAIQYGQNSVAVQDLRLVNGDQQITAEGTFGRPGDSLHLTMQNVDVGTVDALLVREPQLAGRLNGSATVSGTKEAPDVQAEFKIEQGGFRRFKYDSFGGTVNYRGAGITVDARLDQDPTTWLTAKGYVPVALLKPSTAESRAAAHGDAPDPQDRIDLHVDSSPIDIGLVQGFTTSLTDVTGTLQAKVDVTGSAADPHAEGLITLQNGKFTVVPTGVSYSDLGARIELQPDRVHIGAISVLDNKQNALTISGDLALHARQLGSVQIYVNADDFKVIDNKQGDLRIFTNLGLSGELQSPSIEGDLGINTGTINLDRILTSVGESAYATKPTDITASTATEPAEKPPASALDALRMNVRLTVPDDLIVKANDLKAPGAVVGLGKLNVTLGGDVRAQKEPGKPIQVVGAVNTVRGFYDFQGRRFTILRDGKVSFEGLDPTNPTLDLKAERVIQAVTAQVRVRGTVQKPQIELSSVPPLEQADILALIVFNQPVNSLGEGQQVSLAQRAQAMAIGSVTGAIAQSIGSALNLSEFEINMAPENGGGPEVTLGQQVGQNLYLKVQQGIGDQGTTNVILEYELAKWLRFRTNVLQGSSTQQQLFQRAQGSGADVLFFFNY